MKETLQPPDNVPPEQLQRNQREGSQTCRPYQKIRNTLGKTAAVGAALFLTSTSELNPPEESWEQMKNRAKLELTQTGITREQKEAYKFGISEAFYRATPPIAFTPNNLEGYKSIGKKMVRNFIYGRESTKTETGWTQGEENRGEEDALCLYLGLPQKYNTFGISDYKPTRSKENKYYYKINEYKTEFSKANLAGPDWVRNVVNMLGKVGESKPDMGLVNSQIMGQFQLSRGVDEKGNYIAYYDVFNYDVPVEKSGFIGKPFEIYDRIYYNPETFEILE